MDGQTEGSTNRRAGIRLDGWIGELVDGSKSLVLALHLSMTANDILESPNSALAHIAGGEKRRVSVAAELLTRPSVLFMDEPTTGLDSSSASMLVDFLAEFSTGGPSVVLSIH